MSSSLRPRTLASAVESRFPATGNGPARVLTLVATLGLVASFLAVLYGVTSVVGGTAWLAGYTVLALALATALASVLGERSGLWIGGALVAVGMVGYVALLPNTYYALFTPGRLATDVVAMLTGRSVVLLLRADLWAVSIAPGPVFLTWYLALRRSYPQAALVGAGTLVFFVLTGDAEATTTLSGMVALMAMLGFGAIERMDGTWEQVANLGLVAAFVVVVTRALSVVPNGAAASAGGATGPALEGELVGAGNELTVQGAVSLSSERRFTVEADGATYWHAGGYDRYTGGGWARTGRDAPYGGPLSSPPGDSETLKQTFTVEAEVATMPVAWRPVFLGEDAGRIARVSALGGVRPSRALRAGESYTVVSQVPTFSTADLREAGTDYPAAVRRRYFQLPESLPGRVHDTAADVVGDADTPYDAAVAAQTWLAENKTYSLDVRRPEWDIADAFIHEMERGYCTYFATAMIAMLRSQDVPARFVVGYTQGEQNGDGTWIVRGYDSHAWVQVYFPGVGWVNFDPTPSAPRRQAEQRRAGGVASGSPVRTGTGGDEAATTTTAETETTPTADNATDGNESGNSSGEVPDPVAAFPGGGDVNPNNSSTTDDGGRFTAVAVDGNATGNASAETGTDPVSQAVESRDRISAVATLLGLVLGAYRLGVVDRAVKEFRLHYQPRTASPRDDVDRAFDRLEFHLAKRFRDRERGETPGEYVAALASAGADERALRVAEIYERSRYGGKVTRGAADEAIRLVDAVVQSDD